MHLAVEQAQKPMSLVITAGQRGDSPQFQVVLGRIRVPRLGPGRPRTRPDKVRADKAYGSRANRPTCASAASAARSRRSATRPPTARSAVPAVADHRSSTLPTTKSATRWSAESIASSATTRWRRGKTSSPSAMRRPCWSRPSTNGCDQHFRNTL
ncbi:transposase [Streptomyces malaysiensis]|uniref:transposase n=1 Tax=Streptomyces malaysiensis TaxID=92644 RepID=UPI003D7C2B8A